MGGNEQCQYDAGTKSFLVNNDNTIANPHGEVDVIPAADIKSMVVGSTANIFTLAGVKRFPLGVCDPTGLTLGPGKLDLAASSPDLGEARESLSADYQGASVEIGFNSQYLLDFLKASSAGEVRIEFKDSQSAGQLRPSENGDEYKYRYIVMPMRI